MEEKLFEYEDMLVNELIDIMDKKKDGMSFTEADICNGEKILKSMEHIERIAMMNQVSPEEDLMYGANNSYRGTSYGGNSYGNNSSYRNSSGRNQYGQNYGNRSSRANYSNRRSGHSPEDMRLEIQERLNMARDDNERMVLTNWLNDLNSRQ